MRRIVLDYVAAAIDRARPDLESFIAEHLQVPDSFPLTLTEPRTSIQEVRSVKIAAEFQADYPAVTVIIQMRVAVTATAARREAARGVRTAAVPDAVLGSRTFGVDVKLDAIGTVQGLGYHVVPRGARLIAWWGG